MSAAAAVAFVVDTFMHTYITTVIMPLAGIHKHRYQLYHLYVCMYGICLYVCPCYCSIGYYCIALSCIVAVGCCGYSICIAAVVIVFVVAQCFNSEYYKGSAAC